MIEITLSQLAEIISNAETKWKADYTMIKWETENQLRAFQQTQNFIP